MIYVLPPRVYAEDIAERTLARPHFFATLVLHYLRDNPHQRSLRQHAGFWGAIARDGRRARQLRRRAALQARAQLCAARYLDQLKGTEKFLP